MTNGMCTNNSLNNTDISGEFLSRQTRDLYQNGHYRAIHTINNDDSDTTINKRTEYISFIHGFSNGGLESGGISLAVRGFNTSEVTGGGSGVGPILMETATGG